MAAERPLVSIVVVNFNYARFLRQSIDSALVQRYSPVEVIVVDDASTDGSRDTIRTYADKVLPVMQPRNAGQGAAFNAGFLASSGQIVMFLDADDWLYPWAVQRVVETWIAGEAKTHFRLDLVDKDGSQVDVHPPPEVALDSGNLVPLLCKTGRYETTVTTGNAFARAVLDRVMPVPEKDFTIGADGYLAVAVPFHGTVESLDECLGAYRVHGGNAYAASTTTESLDSFFRRTRSRLAHDEARNRVLQSEAGNLGLCVEARPYLQDSMHLELRLASLRMGPNSHPYPQDSRLSLTQKGMAAALRDRASWSRRLLKAAWFAVVGLFPFALASRAVLWKMMSASRPQTIDRCLKWLRHAMR